MNESDRPTRATRRGFDSLEQEVFLSLWRTYDRLRTIEEELFTNWELTPQQYNVLRLLSHGDTGRVPTLELASRLVSRAPDITRMLDKLEARGLITRERPADNRRVVFVALTDRGRQLLDEISGPLAECHAKQLGHLPRRDLEQLAELLRTARTPHESEGSTWR